MKLTEVIKHLVNIESAEKLLSSVLPDIDIDLVEVYMKGKIGFDSDIEFFDSDLIEAKLEIQVNGVNYVNLFPLYMLQEMVEEYIKGHIGLVNEFEIAKRIIAYRINDA